MSRDPRMQKLAKLPVWAPATIGLVLATYLLFGVSSYAWLQGAWPTWAMILCNVYAIYLCFFVWHEGTQRSISRHPVINDIIGTMGAQLLTPTMLVAAYRVLHLQHHRNTGEHAADPDDFLVTAKTWQIPLLFPFVDVFWAAWYVRFHHHRPTNEKILMLISLVTYVMFYAIALSSSYWLEFLLVYVLPQRLAFLCVTFMFARIQHPRGLVQREHPFHATVVNPDTWLYQGPLYMGNGFHVAHHIWPSMPFYRLRQCWLIMREYLEAQNIPYIERRLTEGANAYTPPARPPQRMAMRVSSIRLINAQIKHFTLVPIDAAPLPIARAGAHLTVHLDERTARHYSILNPDDASAYQIAVRLEAKGRGGSKKMHSLQEGAMITVGLVRNFFPLRRPTKQNARALLVAGGIGITPLVAMAKTLQKTGRSFELHLAARDAANAPLALFADEPALIPHVRLHLDDATHSQVQTLEGFQDMGKLNAAQILANYQEGDQLYVCGPAPMMSALLATAKSMHWPDSALFSEYFANPLDGERTAFTIELAKRGKTIHVSAAETALEALEKEGLAVDNVCRQGICGACRCKVIRGEINHRDVILADEERHDTITVCVSRGNENGILVLDLSR